MYCIAPIPQAKAAGRAGRALGLRSVLYRAHQEGAAPAQQGAAEWNVTWQAWQGSGSMLATMLANKTLLGLLHSWFAAAVAFVQGGFARCRKTCRTGPIA